MKLVYSIAKVLGALTGIVLSCYGAYTFIFKQGIESERKANNTENVIQVQSELKKDIENIQTSISLQNQAWTIFNSKYEKDKEEAVSLGVKILKKITIIDTAVDNHLRKSKDVNEYIQWLKNQREAVEKKNSSQIRPELIHYLGTTNLE
jgi:hypothetical protein